MVIFICNLAQCLGQVAYAFYHVDAFTPHCLRGKRVCHHGCGVCALVCCGCCCITSSSPHVEKWYEITFRLRLIKTMVNYVTFCPTYACTTPPQTIAYFLLLLATIVVSLYQECKMPIVQPFEGMRFSGKLC